MTGIMISSVNLVISTSILDIDPTMGNPSSQTHEHKRTNCTYARPEHTSWRRKNVCPLLFGKGPSSPRRERAKPVRLFVQTSLHRRSHRPCLLPLSLFIFSSPLSPFQASCSDSPTALQTGGMGAKVRYHICTDFDFDYLGLCSR